MSADDKRAYLWHMSNHRWEAAMEAVDDDETHPPKNIRSVHEKFIRKRGHKKGGKIYKKNGRMDKR